MQLDPRRLRGNEFAEAVGPLDEHNGIAAVELFGDTKRDRVLGIGQAIEVDVDQHASSARMLVHQGVGRADNVAWLVDLERASNSLDERRLAGAEITDERQHVSGLQALRQALAELARRRKGRERDYLFHCDNTSPMASTMSEGLKPA